jgi:hypothetical protein
MERFFSSAKIFGNRFAFKQASLKAFCFLAAFVWLASALTSSASAATFSREQDVVDLKLGQRVKIDDGTCPPGQVKELSGAKMTASGVAHTRKCVPRLGIKSK